MTARDEMLVRLWRDDVHVEEIAAALGTTEANVYKLASRLRARGVQLAHRAPAGTRALRPCGGTPFEQALARRRAAELMAS